MNTIATSLFPLWLLAAASFQGEVLLEDNFNDNNLDPNKWTTLNYNRHSSVVEQNQRIEIVSRGYLIANGEFDPVADGGLKITGTYKFTSTGFHTDYATVVTRTDATPAGRYGAPSNGILFHFGPFYGLQDGLVIHAGDGNEIGLSELVHEGSFNSAAGMTAFFEVLDLGDQISLTVTEVNNPANSASVSATVLWDTTVERRVCFYNREHQGGDNALGLLDDVVIESALSGPSNQCLRLDGDGDGVLVLPHASLDQWDKYTLEMWVLIENSREEGTDCILLRSGDPYRQTIFLAGDQGDVWMHHNWWHNYNAGTDCGSSDAGDPVWTHVAATFANQEVKLYLNGLLVYACGGMQTPYAGLGYPLRIGYALPFWGDYYTQGKIDEVRLWSQARSEKEIRSTINTRISAAEVVNYPDLVSCWNFEGDVQDSTGLNQAQLIGDPEFVAADDIPILFNSAITWVRREVNGQETDHWYALVDHLASWHRHRNYALLNGSDLVCLETEAENTWVFETFQDDLFLYGTWIGLVQDMTDPDYSEPGGGWKWVNREPLTYDNWWLPNEPNDKGGVEHFGEYVPWGEFNDEKSWTHDNAIIECVSGDCNGNNLPDRYEIARFPKLDANNDGVLDQCQ